MVSSAIKLGALATPQAEQLLQRAHDIAEGMNHHVVDSAHLVVAILENPPKYAGFETVLKGFGFNHASAYETVRNFFPQKEGRPAMEHYTVAAQKMIKLVDEVARKRYQAEHSSGEKLFITVYDMGAAALMSDSVAIHRMGGPRGWKPSFM